MPTHREVPVNQTVENMNQLLLEIAQHMETPGKSNQSAVIAKLERLVAIASTLSFTLQAQRR